MFTPTVSSESWQQLSDQEIINRYLKEKKEHWVNELYRRYIHLIFGACLKYIGDRTVAKEVTLLVFEKMLEQLERQPIEQIRNFNVWLFVLVKNMCISHLRKSQADRNRGKQLEQRQQEEEDEVMENEGWLRLSDDDAKELPPEQLTAWLKEAMTTLEPKQRQCVQLFFYEKMTYKDIQKVTRLDLSKVKSALQNGKRKLRIFLHDKMNSV